MSRRDWIKVRLAWYQDIDHLGLSGDALNLGPLLMALADSDESWRDNGWADLRLPGGEPMPIAGIANAARWPVERVAAAVEELVAVGTLARADDGALRFPTYRKHQEDRTARQKREARAKKAEKAESPGKVPGQSRESPGKVPSMSAPSPASTSASYEPDLRPPDPTSELIPTSRRNRPVVNHTGENRAGEPVSDDAVQQALLVVEAEPPTEPATPRLVVANEKGPQSAPKKKARAKVLPPEPGDEALDEAVLAIEGYRAKLGYKANLEPRSPTRATMRKVLRDCLVRHDATPEKLLHAIAVFGHEALGPRGTWAAGCFKSPTGVAQHLLIAKNWARYVDAELEEKAPPNARGRWQRPMPELHSTALPDHMLPPTPKPERPPEAPPSNGRGPGPTLIETLTKYRR